MYRSYMFPLAVLGILFLVCTSMLYKSDLEKRLEACGKSPEAPGVTASFSRGVASLSTDGFLHMSDYMRKSSDWIFCMKH